MTMIFMSLLYMCMHVTIINRNLRTNIKWKKQQGYKRDRRLNPCIGELSVSIFYSFEAEITSSISSLK